MNEQSGKNNTDYYNNTCCTGGGSVCRVQRSLLEDGQELGPELRSRQSGISRGAGKSRGRGLIQERKIGTDEIIEFEVSGEIIQAVHMLPGYTHSIINLSDTENLVTFMWANEIFDGNHPDTFGEPV